VVLATYPKAEPLRDDNRKSKVEGTGKNKGNSRSLVRLTLVRYDIALGEPVAEPSFDGSRRGKP
jgi:hypothetical protein